jgi:hypothetical protein
MAGEAVVIFSRANTLGSVAIRLAQAPTLAPWSHCSDLVPGGYVIEALALRKRVVATPLPELLDRVSAFQALALRVDDYVRWVAAVTAWDGTPYDYLGALGAWLQTRRIDSPEIAYCSEVSSSSLASAGRDLRCPGTRGVLPWAWYRLLWAAGARAVPADELRAMT